MENTKSGRQRERQWTPTRAKAQDTRASLNTLGNSPSEEEIGHWTPTGNAPMVIWMDGSVLNLSFIFRWLFANF